MTLLINPASDAGAGDSTVSCAALQRGNCREIYYHNVRQQQTRYSQQLLRIYILINELSHFFPQRITKTPEYRVTK